MISQAQTQSHYLKNCATFHARFPLWVILIIPPRSELSQRCFWCVFALQHRAPRSVWLQPEHLLSSPEPKPALLVLLAHTLHCWGLPWHILIQQAAHATQIYLNSSLHTSLVSWCALPAPPFPSSSGTARSSSQAPQQGLCSLVFRASCSSVPQHSWCAIIATRGKKVKTFQVTASEQQG